MGKGTVIGFGWAIARDRAAYEAAVKLARGCYQLSLLGGRESLSGSTLKGKASKYGAVYAVSRANLLARVTAAGIPWFELRGPHGKRVLVWGVPTAAELASDSVARVMGRPPVVRQVA